jgi:hypothetical protein
VSEIQEGSADAHAKFSHQNSLEGSIGLDFHIAAESCQRRERPLDGVGERRAERSGSDLYDSNRRSTFDSDLMS